MSEPRRPTEQERADALDAALDRWITSGGRPPAAGVEQLAALGDALDDAGVPSLLFEAAWARSGPRRRRLSSPAWSRAAAIWIVVALFAGFFVGRSTMNDDGSDARLISEVDRQMQEVSEAVGEARGYDAAGRPDLADDAEVRAEQAAERARLLSERLNRSERERIQEILRRRLADLSVERRRLTRQPAVRGDGSDSVSGGVTTTTFVRLRDTTSTLSRRREVTTTTELR